MLSEELEDIVRVGDKTNFLNPTGIIIVLFVVVMDNHPLYPCDRMNDRHIKSFLNLKLFKYFLARWMSGKKNCEDFYFFGGICKFPEGERFYVEYLYWRCYPLVCSYNSIISLIFPSDAYHKIFVRRTGVVQRLINFWVIVSNLVVINLALLFWNSETSEVTSSASSQFFLCVTRTVRTVIHERNISTFVNYLILIYFSSDRK